MEASDVVAAIILLSQTVSGVLGNGFLLCNYLMLYFTGCSLKGTDMILQHLNIANFLTLVCRGVPQTMTAFGLQDFFGDLGCKLTFYLHRVGRGVSISSTCLLSIFQAITMSPRNSTWTALKTKTPKYIDFSMYFSWFLYLLGNIGILKNMTRNQANQNMTGLKEYGYCSAFRFDKTFEILIAVFLSFPDAVCMGLMLCASSSIVLVLHRHKQRMQLMLRANVCPRFSPETRATKTVLLLVSTFVFFYTLSCLCQVSLVSTYNPSFFLRNMAVVVVLCFPTVSPFLLLSRDSNSYNLCFMWLRNRKPWRSS